MTLECSNYSLVSWIDNMPNSMLKLTTSPVAEELHWQDVSRISMISDDEAWLEDIFARDESRKASLGTALLQAGMLWAHDRGHSIVRGRFIPSGNRNKIKSWYEHRGIVIYANNDFIGRVETVIGLCGEILARNNVTYSVYR